jgi:hypothetical protein
VARKSKTHIQDAGFSAALFEQWDKLDDRGRDLAAVRELVCADRFYLLARVCRRLDILHPWLYARCREVEGAPDGYLDLWAREHYKSTIITFGGILQEILRDPEITVGLFSHSQKNASGFGKQIARELMSNRVLINAFPDILYDAAEKEAPSWSLIGGWTVKRKGNPKEATLQAHGLVDGMPTGAHFRLRVYDDTVTRDSVNTPEQIQRTTEMWELSNNLGTTDGREWYVGTRYHFGDSYQEMMDRGAVKPRLYPATDDGSPDGTPVLFTKEVWEDKKIKQGPATIACQMLQNPLAGKQRMFDVTDMETYECRPETLNVYIMVDPARSKKKTSANTAMAVIGVDYALNKYLLDGFNHKMDLLERWRNLRELVIKWRRAGGICMVKVGYESIGAAADLQYFTERMRVEGPVFEIVELTWAHDGDSSKVDRVGRIGPDLRMHRWYTPYETNMKHLTKSQTRMVSVGAPYRIAKPIKRQNEEGKIYDLTKDFKLQLDNFPYWRLVDLVDAASRIYDMEILPPSIVHVGELEPEWT